MIDAADKVLVFVYTPIDYNVNYTLNDLPYGGTETWHYGDKVPVRGNPSETGWTFQGWSLLGLNPFTETTDEGVVTYFYMPANNIVIPGIMDKSVYFMTYDYVYVDENGVETTGKLPLGLDPVDGEKADYYVDSANNVKPVPQLTGWTITGWYKKKNQDGTYSDRITGNTYNTPGGVTLYAKVRPITYKLKYKYVDALGNSIPSRSLPSGLVPRQDSEVGFTVVNGALVPTVPQVPGWTITGWNTKALMNGTAYAGGSTFKEAKDSTLYAMICENQVKIEYEAGEGGDVRRRSEIIGAVTGTARGSEADPDFGYDFLNWTNAANTVVSLNANFTPQKVNGLNVAAKYKANFVEEKATIRYQATTGGTVSNVLETINALTGVPVGSTATPAPGYRFDRWTFDLNAWWDSDDKSLMPQKQGMYSSKKYVNVTYTAHFEEKDKVKITYVSNDLDMGTVNPGYELVRPVTGTADGSLATPKPGYRFLYWKSSANSAWSSAAADLEPPKNADNIYETVTYEAYFEEIMVTIDYKAGPGGSVDPMTETIGAATGDPQGSTAKAAFGYSFVKWTNAQGDVVGTDPFFEPGRVGKLNVPGTYTAHFAEDEATILYEAEIGGQVSNASETVKVLSGSPEGSIASANPGYTFSGWASTLSPSWSSSDASLMPEKQGDGDNKKYVNVTYTAHFTENQVTIDYVAGTGGSVNPTTETIGAVTDTADGSTATTLPGYTFLNWTDANNNIVGTDEDFTPAKVGGLNVAGTYTANFTENQVTIDYVAGTGGSVNPTTETIGAVTDTADGSTATTLPGYTFLNWTDANNNIVGTDEDFTPAKVGGLNVAGTYTANFEPIIYTLTYAFVDENGDPITTPTGLTLPVSVPYTVATPATVAAVPTLYGWTITGWNVAADLSGDAYMGGNQFSAVGGGTLYAQVVPIKIDVTGTVDWIYGPASPESPKPKAVQVQLYANDEPAPVPVHTFTGTTTGFEVTWTYTWPGLDMADQNGNPIKYTIAQIDALTGYTTTQTGDLSVLNQLQYFLVRFINDGGAVLKDSAVSYNGSTTPPATPSKTGFTFRRWTGGVWKKVTANQLIRPLYNTIPGPNVITELGIPLAGGTVANVGDTFD